MSLSYDPAQGHGNVVNYNPNTNFEAQQKGPPPNSPNGSFMLACGCRPNLIYNPLGNQTPIRISQNGNLAVEKTDLTTRQPKYFFATPNLIAAWNERLKKVGSSYELVANNNESIQFDWNGVAKNLHRIDARRA